MLLGTFPYGFLCEQMCSFLLSILLRLRVVGTWGEAGIATPKYFFWDIDFFAGYFQETKDSERTFNLHPNCP